MSTAATPPAPPVEKTFDWFPAKDNPMFPPEMTALIRFARQRKDGQKPQCAYCKKKAKTMWTMTCPFRIVDMAKCTFEAVDQPEVFPPLALVCDDHPMNPAIDRRALFCICGD